MLIRRRLVVLYMIFPTVTVVEFCLKKKDGHQGITFHYKYIAGLSRDNQLVTPLQFSWSARFISACIRQCRWRPSKGLCAPLQSLTHCGYTGVLIVLPPTPTFRLPSSAKVANQRHHNTESLRVMALNCLQKTNNATKMKRWITRQWKISYGINSSCLIFCYLYLAWSLKEKKKLRLIFANDVNTWLERARQFLRVIDHGTCNCAKISLRAKTKLFFIQGYNNYL